MPLAKALKRMGTDKRVLRRSLACAVVVFGLSVAMPAWSDCLSPSAEAGATTTTVYPCQEETASGQQPVIVDIGKADSSKSTVVERGSAEVPWFEPKPTTTADPIVPPKTASENEKKEEPAAEPKEEIVKIEPVPMEAPEKAEVQPTDVKVKAMAVEPEATEAEPVPDKAKPTRTKVTKAKSTKTKVAKAKRTKVKLAKTKRLKTKLAQDKLAKTKTETAESVEPQPEPAKTKRTKTKLAQDKRAKAKTVKAESAEPRPEPAKTEPATDSNVIVMTKKDMSLGSRVKNWFGF